MNDKADKAVEQARFIFTTARLIQERILKEHAQFLAKQKAGEKFMELSAAQYRCLLTVRICGKVTVGELARRLGVSPASASVMVERLVEKGMLKRTRSKQDRRKVMVTLTAQAEKFADSLEEHMLHVFTDLVRKVGPETAAMWCEVLSRIKEHLMEEPTFSNGGEI